MTFAHFSVRSAHFGQPSRRRGARRGAHRRQLADDVDSVFAFGNEVLPGVDVTQELIGLLMRPLADPPRLREGASRSPLAWNMRSVPLSRRMDRADRRSRRTVGPIRVCH
ncbi:hypothetical protein ACFUJR_17145 [Streptomyces sp. NPDC057271]|uniref:hypothetical protein n=1 Tax=unclassified Streptomyces TaxID=2593676 RepID=UPI0036312A5C